MPACRAGRIVSRIYKVRDYMISVIKMKEKIKNCSK